MTVSLFTSDEATLVMYREHLTYKLFQVDRVSGLATGIPGSFTSREACLLAVEALFVGVQPSMENFDALLGMIPGFFCTTLVFADAKPVGEFFGISIFQVKQIHMVEVQLLQYTSHLLNERQAYIEPFLPELRRLLERQTAEYDPPTVRKAEINELTNNYNEILKAVDEFPFENTFYSPDFDLCSIKGVFSELCEYGTDVTLHAERPDLSRYCTNCALLMHLVERNIFAGSELIFGGVSCFFVGSLRWLVVTRQSCLNAGTRYNARGLNSRCAAANEYETELLLYSGDRVMSFVTLRGSPPIFFKTENALLRAKFTVQQEQLNGVYWKHTICHYERLVALSLLKEKDSVKVEDDGESDETTVETRYREEILEQGASADGHTYCMLNFPWHSAIRKAPKTMRGATTTTAFGPDELSRFHGTAAYCETIYAASEMLEAIGNSDLFPDISIAIVDTNNRQFNVKLILKEKTLFRISCADSLDRTNMASYFLNLHIAAIMGRLVGMPQEELHDLVKKECGTIISRVGISNAMNDVQDSCASNASENRRSHSLEQSETAVGSPRWHSNKICTSTDVGEFERDIFGIPGFSSLSLHFCCTGDAISLFYTQSQSSHSEIWDLLLDQKRQSNAFIGVRRRLQNTFSDEQKNYLLELFFATDARMHLELLPLGTICSANDGFGAMISEQWMASMFSNLQNRYFEYQISWAMRAKYAERNPLMRYLLHWRDIFMQRGNSDFSHYYLYTHDPTYHSQNQLLEMCKENAYSSLNSEFVLKEVISRGRETTQSIQKLMSGVFGTGKFYQISAAEFVNFEQLCLEEFKQEPSTPRHYMGDCIAIRTQLPWPAIISQIIVEIPSVDDVSCTPDSLVVIGESMQGWDFCLANFALPIAEPYVQLINHSAHRLNLPLAYTHQAQLQQITELFENVGSQSLRGSYAVVKPKITIIFRASQEQIVRLPRIRIIGEPFRFSIARQVQVPRSIVENFIKAYDNLTYEELNKMTSYKPFKIMWFVLSKSSSSLFLEYNGIKASEIDPVFAGMDDFFTGYFALNYCLFMSGISLAFFSSLFNAYGSNQLMDIQQLKVRLASHPKTLKFSSALSEQFGDAKMDFQEILKKYPETSAIEQGEFCAHCQQQDTLFQCENCDAFVCEQCCDETMTSCILNGNLMKLTLLCKKCFESNCQACALVTQYCEAYARCHDTEDEQLPRFTVVNGGDYIDRLHYTIQDDRITFLHPTDVTALVLLGCIVSEILVDGIAIEFHQHTEEATRIITFISKHTHIMEVHGCSLSTVCIYGSPLLSYAQETIPNPELCTMQSTIEVDLLAQSILDSYVAKEPQRLLYHFVFRSAAKVCKIGLKTNSAELSLPVSFVIQYRDLLDLDTPKKFKKQYGLKPRAVENQEANIIWEKRYVCNYQLHCVAQAVDYVEEAYFMTDVLQIHSNRFSVVLENGKWKEGDVSVILYGKV